MFDICPQRYKTAAGALLGTSIVTTVMESSAGIALGLITHCLILLLTGKAREVKPLTIIVSLIFVARYAFMTLG